MSKARSRRQLTLSKEGDEKARWLTTGEAAIRLGVAAKTISKWIDEGRLLGVRIPGSRDRRVHPQALEDFEREHGYDRARGKR